jgi:hypothetical protein
MSPSFAARAPFAAGTGGVSVVLLNPWLAKTVSHSGPKPGVYNSDSGTMRPAMAS